MILNFLVVPPEIRDQEKVTNTSVVVNHPVSLFCEVSGNPFPIISWYKEDTQVGTVKLIEVTIAISSSRIFCVDFDFECLVLDLI